MQNDSAPDLEVVLEKSEEEITKNPLRRICKYGESDFLEIDEIMRQFWNYLLISLFCRLDKRYRI